MIDLVGLRVFLKDSLGWGEDKVTDTMTPIIKVLNDRRQGKANMQGSLEKFFDVTAGAGGARKIDAKHKSAKMQEVIKVRRSILCAPDAPRPFASSAPKQLARRRRLRKRKRPRSRASLVRLASRARRPFRPRRPKKRTTTSCLLLRVP